MICKTRTSRYVVVFLKIRNNIESWAFEIVEFPIRGEEGANVYFCQEKLPPLGRQQVTVEAVEKIRFGVVFHLDSGCSDIRQYVLRDYLNARRERSY